MRDLPPLDVLQPGAGASSRHAPRTSSPARGRPLCTGLRKEGRREEETMAQAPGTKSCSTSSGTTYLRPVEERPRPCRALEREAPANRGAERDGLLLTRWPTSSTIQRLDQARRRRRPSRPIGAPGPRSSVITARTARADHRGAARRRSAARGRRSGPVGGPRGSGRAVPRAAGMSPRTRSGSLSRARERLGHLARDAVDGDLSLCHRLEQRRLRLRCRPVDLVDEDDVRENRPRAELEVTLARL